jgi:hypothetical protein
MTGRAEDELETARVGLDRLRQRRNVVVAQLRELYDLVVSTADDLGSETGMSTSPADPATEVGMPPPPSAAYAWKGIQQRLWIGDDPTDADAS